MNLTRLIEEVGALGFESELVADIPFIRFANRALYTIFSERGEESALTVLASAKMPMLHISEIFHSGGESCKIDTGGKAYCFKACGKGSFSVHDSTGVKTVHFDSSYGIFRGHLTGKSYICFEGEYSYTVRDLVCYKSLFGSEISDIPIFTREVSYSLKEYAADFLTPCKVPTDSAGNSVIGARVEGDRLILPYTYSGEVTVPYKRAPRNISADSPDEMIDIPPDSETLLPSLTAAYLWLDDDADKAQYYMGLYRDGMDRLLRSRPANISPEYTDVLRWA